MVPTLGEVEPLDAVVPLGVVVPIGVIASVAEVEPRLGVMPVLESVVAGLEGLPKSVVPLVVAPLTVVSPPGMVPPPGGKLPLEVVPPVPLLGVTVLTGTVELTPGPGVKGVLGLVVYTSGI